MNIHKLYDAQGNAEYDIDKKFELWGDEYEITVLEQNPDIPREWTVFLTCIEDAIADSQMAKEAKSSKKRDKDK